MDEPTRSEPRPRKPPRKITPRYLQNSAMHYLKRYTAPRAHLRRVMMRRIWKSVQFHGGEVGEHEVDLDAVLDKLEAAHMLDDRRWTFARVDELHRRGESRRGIQAKLAAKGAPRELVDEALARIGQDDELEAARQYAKRRRLGPWCLDDDVRAEKRQKHLASLARRGFSYDVARRAVDGEAD